MGWTAEEVAARPKLHITVTNDNGETVYKTWNADEGWKTVTLYLGETEPPLADARKDVMGEVIGKSRWDYMPAAQLARGNQVLVKFAGELVERMVEEGEGWGPPVQCRLARNEDGTYELWTRTVPT